MKSETSLRKKRTESSSPIVAYLNRTYYTKIQLFNYSKKYPARPRDPLINSAHPSTDPAEAGPLENSNPPIINCGEERKR